MTEIVNDRSFAGGFEVRHVEKRVTDKPVAVFKLKNTTNNYPSWQIAQWCNKNNLANGKEIVRQDGSFQIYDQSKRVIVYSENNSATLEIDTGNEYTVPRVEGEGWPHLLLEQWFKERKSVFSAEKIEAKINICINKVVALQKDLMPHHTAQISWIFAIADKNNGDYVWFGMPVYDFRWDYPSVFIAQDGGKPENTGKLIYFIDSRKYLSAPVEIGKKVSISLDVKPFMQDAILEAKKRGFLKNSKPEDMVIENTNIGWEVTGTFDVSATVSDISVEVY